MVLLGYGRRLLFSWLVDADRLDTAEFEGGSFICDWDYDKLWNLFSGKLEDKLHSFALPAGGKARAIALERQKSVMPANTLVEKPGIYSLSVPTGSGKTLIVCMRFALAQAKKYHKNELSLSSPYTSIIDQKCQRNP